MKVISKDSDDYKYLSFSTLNRDDSTLNRDFWKRKSDQPFYRHSTIRLLGPHFSDRMARLIDFYFIPNKVV